MIMTFLNYKYLLSMFIIPRPVLCVLVISHQYYSIRELFAELNVHNADAMMLNTVCGD